MTHEEDAPMPAWICQTCAVQQPDTPQPPGTCPICADERQYVGWAGQQWTTMAEIAADHAVVVREEEPGLTGIGVQPAFGIGQRALLVRTPGGNVLWDCVPLLDEAARAQITSLGTALSAAAGLVKGAEQEAASVTEELNTPERDALRKAFGEGSTGKGVAKAVRGSAGAMKDLEDRQKSRATRLKRDALDRALLDLAAFYRDVLVVQLAAGVDLASAGHEGELRRLAAASTPESTVRRMEAIMTCRERLEVNVAPLLAVEELTVALLTA